MKWEGVFQLAVLDRCNVSLMSRLSLSTLPLDSVSHLYNDSVQALVRLVRLSFLKTLGFLLLMHLRELPLEATRVLAVLAIVSIDVIIHPSYQDPPGRHIVAGQIFRVNLGVRKVTAPLFVTTATVVAKPRGKPLIFRGTTAIV
jgi:hypothetical protein